MELGGYNLLDGTAKMLSNKKNKISVRKLFVVLKQCLRYSWEIKHHIGTKEICD